MIPNTSVPRALRASVQGTELLQKQKCVETLNANADSVLRSNFAGGGFAKPRLFFLKFGGIRVFAPQEGAGGMRGGDLVFGGRDRKLKQKKL